MDNNQRKIDDLIESKIIDTLKSIGFPESVDSWQQAKPAVDPDGQTLRLLGHPVMEAWEEPYMKKLAEIATSKANVLTTDVGKGMVLELGFGLGLSAGFIQQNTPRQHVIIEMNHAIAETAREFARHQSNRVTILEGTWQEIVPLLESDSYQGILFDTYPLTEEEVDVIFYPFIQHAYRLLAPGGIFTYYSDEANWFSDEHLTALQEAGFSKINGELVSVTPPPDCLYWHQSTILAPRIEK
ncbi:MAG: class I SAM-dependent methyltransferase [Blastocatellales bacterium]|nr:class I SAM-dependent methyltransferase [Nitrosomonas nitrosa]